MLKHRLDDTDFNKFIASLCVYQKGTFSEARKNKVVANFGRLQECIGETIKAMVDNLCSIYGRDRWLRASYLERQIAIGKLFHEAPKWIIEYVCGGSQLRAPGTRRSPGTNMLAIQKLQSKTLTMV